MIVKEKIYNIEFLRVLACLTIILMHLFNNFCLHSIYPNIALYKTLFVNLSHGQLAVDLFFIISGFFFIYKINTGISMFNFLKKKLFKFWPVLFCMVLMSALTSFFIPTLKFSIYENILVLIGLNGTGMFNVWGNIFQFWYVSSMMWCLCFYFYLYKYYEQKSVNLIIAIIVFLSYTMIISSFKGNIYGKIENFYNLLNVGILRALAGIGIGYFVGLWYVHRQRNINSTRVIVKYIVSLVEILCIFFIIKNFMFYTRAYNNDIIYIIVFALTIVLFSCKYGYVSQFLNKPFWEKLSRYTYSIYMVHTSIYVVYKNTLWSDKNFVQSYPVLQIIIALVTVLILGVCLYHFVEQPCYQFLKRKYK